MLNRFHTIPACYGQTDGRTDRIATSISHVSTSMLMRDKNEPEAMIWIQNPYQLENVEKMPDLTIYKN